MSTPAADVHSVLVYVGSDRVGDGLLKLPFVRALRAAYPEARVTWLAGKGGSAFAGVLAPLVEGLIDEVITDGRVGENPGELIRPRLPGSYDLIIDTQRSVFIALVLKRMPHKTFISASARFLLSEVKPKAGYRPPRSLLQQMLDLLSLATGEPLTPPAWLEVALDEEALATATRLLPEGPVYVGLAPGAGGPRKCWPLASYVALAKRVASNGRVPVFILGTMEDGWRKDIAAEVPDALFPVQTAGMSDGVRFDPRLTMALAGRLAVAVSNDSGLGHMLSAGGMPLISLFGPTPPEKFPPLAKSLTVITAGDFGSTNLDAIPVDAVAHAIERVLQR